MDESPLHDIFTLATALVSKLQLVVDLSATEVKFVATTEGNKEAIWLE